jgi:hypothetical protein
VEIDMVAVDEDSRRIRFATCKRNPDRLPGCIDRLRYSTGRFLAANRRFEGWTSEYVAIAPSIGRDLRTELQGLDVIPQDLEELTRSL